MALGIIGKDAGNNISFQAFKYGYAFSAFYLLPSHLDGEQFEMAKFGPLSIELKFADVPLRPAHFLIYAELDSVLEISKTRQVLTNNYP